MFRIQNRRVPSFSLIEMLVVLVLSSIMVGIIYFVFFTVNSFYIKLTRKQNLDSDIQMLYYLVNKDWDRSNVIYATSASAFACHADGLKIDYTFTPLYAVRKQGERIDT